MSNNRDIGYAIVGFFFGIWYFFGGFKRLRRKRLIENIPTSTIRGLAIGLVEITGRAEPVTILRSPLTKTECVSYKYLIEEYRSSGKSGRWVTVAEGDSFYSPFWLNDNTGKIMVYVQGAELILSADYEFKTGLCREIPGNLIEFMDKNKISYKNWIGKRNMRFKEWFIQEKDNIYVIGSAKKIDTNKITYNDVLMNRVEELKKDKQKMEEIDLDKNGKISEEEWNNAVSELEKEVLDAVIKNTETLNNSDVVISMGDEETMFMISDRSEKDVLHRLSKECFLGIFGGAGLSLVLLGYLLVRLGVVNIK
jgi:hypothetical protein